MRVSTGSLTLGLPDSHRDGARTEAACEDCGAPAALLVPTLAHLPDGGLWIEDAPLCDECARPAEAWQPNPQEGPPAATGR